MRFVLDGEVMELNDVDPNRTVLQFLREDLARTGTKEGCAEGDCGACTVVVAELDEAGKRLRPRAINSCIQFLATLDGKELFTVESLSDSQNDLHPVQRAMIDDHGSQCGFCTPGFVMSLFALYKNESSPDRRKIDEALAGNLCRCTGYQPIIAAAQNMYNSTRAVADWRFQAAGSDLGPDERRRVEALHAIGSERSLLISGEGREFYAPNTLSELSTLLLDHPRATVLAGGTDVGLWVSKQHRELETIIYVGNVAELRRMAIKDNHIEIGAATTLSDAMPLIVEHIPSLHEIFVRFASPPIRNAGTLGGNIANGSPIGDSMPALLALDTKVVLRKGDASRTINLSDYYVAYQESVLQQCEFVERILIPLPDDDIHVESYKVSKRFDQDISAVCAAFCLSVKDGRVHRFRAAYGGMAAIPARATQCEDALVGCDWNESSIKQAAAALEADFEPLSDMRASAHYRRQVSKNLLRRFYLSTTAPAMVSVYDYGR